MAVVNSAYEERFRGSFKSVSGRDWFVSIYDRNWTATGALYAPPYNFVITDNGLNIQYDCEGDEKFAPIVGSKLKLNFMVDYADTSEQQGDFVDDLLGYGPNGIYVEGDLFVVVREGSAIGSVIFVGEYLQDLDTLPDTSGPFPIQLTFTDGIGKLKETTWDSQNIDLSLQSYSAMGYKSFSFWISQCLLQTNFYKTPVNPDGFWDGPDNRTGFYTSCRWYNTDMYYKPNSFSTSGDVLHQTQGQTKWANKFNPSNGQLNIASCYEVLKQICKSWGMRVIAWQGQWYVYQIEQYQWKSIAGGGFVNEWQNVQDSVRYQYKADGTPTHRRTSLGFRQFDRFNNYMYNAGLPGKRTQKLQGGSYKFLPVLKEVKLNLVHEGFQNVFGGIPQETGFGTNGNLLIGGPFLNSLQFKFETNLHMTITTPSGSNLTSWNLTNFDIRIIAMPPGSTTIANAMATLEYDSSNQSYGWDDSPTYQGSDLGPVVTHYTVGGPYPAGTSQTVPLSPKLKFPGYRDAATDYMIILASPVYISNQIGTLISAATGYPYGSSYIWTYANPIDTTALSPPSWSTGLFNQFLSTIQPVSSLSSTANTIFVDTQTDDSHKLDWGDVYWGDGPEYWDDSALRVQTGAATYEFTDWTSKDWAYRLPSQSGNPSAGSGQVFTEQLAMTMKYSQSSVLKRANFKLADSPDETTFNGWNIMVNPVGNIQDIAEESDGTQTEKKFFFRRGNFNMIMNEWDGEWIEATYDIPSVPQIQFRLGGGENLRGPGNTLAGALSSGSNTSAQARLTLLRTTKNVVAGTAISSILIQVNRGELIDSQTDFLLNQNYKIMTGDKVWMVYDNGIKYELTVTSDVANDSEILNFSEFTPTYDSPTPPLIQIPMLKLWENMNRKTSGSIAGFVVSDDDLTKDGIAIDGFLDSDSMTGASATTLPTSESVKAYVDNSHPAEDQTLQEVTDNGNTTTNSITFAGGTSDGNLTIQAASPVLKIDAPDSGYPEIYFTRLVGDDQNARIKLRANQLRFENAGDPDSTYLFQGRAAGSGSLSDFLKIEDTGIITTGGTFSNQVTIPATPIASTDAASKGYVDGKAGLNETLQDVTDNGNTTTNRVMIGGTTYLYAGVDLNVGNISDSQNGIGIITSPTGYGYVLFGDSTGVAAYAGTIAYNHNVDSMNFSTSSVEKMRITSAGNVGIGTTAPNEKLNVYGSVSLSTGNAFKMYNSAGSGWGELRFNESDNRLQFNRGIQNSGSDFLLSENSVNSYVSANEGNFGIGTTAPYRKLQVVGNSTTSGISTGTSTSPNSAELTANGTNYAAYLLGHSFLSFGTNHLNLGTTAAEKMRITSAGNVLIGTTTASGRKLSIDGNAELLNSNELRFYNTGNTNWGQIKSPLSGVMEISTGGGIAMTLLGNGNVGIGTTSPTAKLESISPNGNQSSLRLGRGDNSNYWDFNHAGNDLRIFNGATSGSNILLGVDPGGGVKNNNVGIGTATPSAKLHVVGTGKFSGQVTIPATPTEATHAASKEYVDSQSGGGTALSVFSMLTCSTTTITTNTNGVASAVVMKFDNEAITVGPSAAIEVFGSDGIENVDNSQFCWSIKNDTTSLRYFEFLWNVTSNTNTVNNRLLSGIRLQTGVIGERGGMEWTTINPTTSYIYDRGTGTIRKGSSSGSIIIGQPASSTINYFRMEFWKESASNAGVKSESVLNGTQITIKQLK